MNEVLAAEQMARVGEPLARAWTLPRTAYTEPSVFAAEAERIFRRDWLCVARVEELAKVGDYRCVDLVDQPIAVTRARDGEIHAFSRICLHRAMPLAAGAGNASRFVCPYHNWTYELDGRLRSAPMMDGVEGFHATAAGCRPCAPRSGKVSCSSIWIPPASLWHRSSRGSGRCSPTTVSPSW